MKTPAPDAGLTFDWPQRERFPLVLFACVFLSLVAHVASFFVFQVVYPQRVTIPPPAPQLALLTASSPENEALLRWIAAEDPALVANAHSVIPPGLLEVPYRPSFDTLRTAPRGSTEPPIVVQYPPARSPLAIIQGGTARPAPAAPAAPGLPTQVDFSAALRGRTPPTPATFVWTHRATESLVPLRALIGVSDRGEVRYVFLQQPSGLPAIDTEALAQLQRVSFVPGGPDITWAQATVTFGADAYAQKAPAP